jgi:hypothetical protein
MTIAPPADSATAQTSGVCANCGAATDIVMPALSLSVHDRDGGYRFAPPLWLCETCKRNITYRRVWRPAWCASCQAWKPFGHRD